jgi:hypothetical protein
MDMEASQLLDEIARDDPYFLNESFGMGEDNLRKTRRMTKEQLE